MGILTDKLQAPAGHLLQFEPEKADPDKHTIYSQPPSSEVDKAWDDLVRRMITVSIVLLLEANVSPSAIYFSATEEEVKSSNEDPDDTVSLIDKEGYLGTIGVYHGLHCMVSMLNFFKRDNY
jgi:hypothetical protein